MTEEAPREDLVSDVVDLIVDSVNLHHLEKARISETTPLTQGGLELDSVDLLEIVVAVEQKYGVKIQDVETGRRVFQDVGSVAKYVRDHQV